jgi:hypothetical protein
MARKFSKGFELAGFRARNPLDPSMTLFLVVKCPNCQRLIRFSLSGIFGEGWSMRTFFCKGCNQTHAITMFFESKTGTVLSDTANYSNLTESLLRASGSRQLHKAHSLMPGQVRLDDPAKMLGYPTATLAKFLSIYVKTFERHVNSTIWEKKLHPIEVESLKMISSILLCMKNMLKKFTGEEP